MESCFWDLLDEIDKWPFMEYWDMLLEALGSEIRDVPFNDPIDDWLGLFVIASRGFVFFSLAFTYVSFGRMLLIICLTFFFYRLRQIDNAPNMNTPIPVEPTPRDPQPEGLGILGWIKAIWSFIKTFFLVML